MVNIDPQHILFQLQFVLPRMSLWVLVHLWTENNIFNKSDINELYLSDDYLLKIEYPYNRDMGKKFVQYITEVQKKYLENNDVYLSIIPDKNYFGSSDSLKGYKNR